MSIYTNDDQACDEQEVGRCRCSLQVLPAGAPCRCSLQVLSAGAPCRCSQQVLPAVAPSRCSLQVLPAGAMEAPRFELAIIARNNNVLNRLLFISLSSEG